MADTMSGARQDEDTRTGTATTAAPGTESSQGTPTSAGAASRDEGGRAKEWRGEVTRRDDGVSRSEVSAENGRTHIADTVVAKIAAFAAREIPGVHSMGGGLTRRIGALKARIPGQTDGHLTPTQGVAVEVGEKQAAVDIDLVTVYGESIVEVTEAVRRNVMERVQDMTGLEVVEVNINVDDIFVDDGSEEQSEPAPSRVQ